MDYRLSVLLTISIPLVVLIWAVVAKLRRSSFVDHLLAGGEFAGNYTLPDDGCATCELCVSVMARGLDSCLSVVLEDLNEEIADRPQSPLKLAFTAGGGLLLFTAVGCDRSNSLLKLCL